MDSGTLHRGGSANPNLAVSSGAAKVFIASDHRGLKLKQKILEKHPDYLDLGPFEYNPDDDYNDYAINLAKNVRDASISATPFAEPPAFGIIICGSAHGVSIQANRFKRIRAIVAMNKELARLGREHNNANVLCLSADFVNEAEVPEIIDVFMTTLSNTEQKYRRRNKKLDMYGG